MSNAVFASFAGKSGLTISTSGAVQIVEIQVNSSSGLYLVPLSCIAGQIAKDEDSEIISEYPSGGWRTIHVLAMVPLAPGLFSMITGSGSAPGPSDRSADAPQRRSNHQDHNRS